ncbi:MAG: TetR/AcrR family transcriptional regulator [Peptococcaceae bacterium]|nr:TetR/AcrR family transcriptional regulator [Peptococcaceae bacterium]
MDGLKKNSKKPEVRRQELIDVAAALFAEKGYEAVAVRDILNAVNGAPGMFYYYFKSKQDIYLAAMDQYIDQRLARKCEILEDEAVAFDEKLAIFRSMVEEDVQGYMARFAPDAAASISDTSYKLYDLVHMLSRMVAPYAKLILQGIRENRLSNRFDITEDSAEAFATFVLYGAWGMMYNHKFTGEGAPYDLESVLKITDQLFY